MLHATFALNRTQQKLILGTAVLTLLIPLTRPAQAQTLTTLYDFSEGTGGDLPESSLVIDQHGNLYGTTYAGGNLLSCPYAFPGCGTVFELKHPKDRWIRTILHRFDGTDGAYPLAGLVVDAQGNLYGTTMNGGDAGRFGSGTMFEITPAGSTKVLHTFFWPDGSEPASGLTRDSNGNFYGTTYYGGTTPNYGTVFEVSADGLEKTLYSFTGGDDGGNPINIGFLLYKHGALYGTTSNGGTHRAGTVFKVALDGMETVLYSFTGTSDGANPYASLVSDKKGNLYGTTYAGGAYGYGTVFMLRPSKGGWTETVLHSFNDLDGANPWSGLALDRDDNLFGTAKFGGSPGCGTIFELRSSRNQWTYSVLHVFNYQDGCLPLAALLIDRPGNFYGSTEGGGAHGWGTVFRLTVKKSAASLDSDEARF